MSEVKVIDAKDYTAQYGDAAHVLVDVREVEEYENGHLPGAVNVPLSEFQARYTEIPTDRTVVLVCRSGGRSQMAAEFLHSTGQYHGDLVNLDGGTLEWVKAGYEVEV